MNLNLTLGSSGTSVIAWLDQSGLGNNLTSSGEPTFIFSATPSGQSAVSLDGVNDKLERSIATSTLSGLPTANANRSIYVVARFNTTSSYAGVAYGKASFNQTFGLVNSPAGNLVLQGYGGGYDHPTVVDSISAGWTVLEAVLNNGIVTVYKEGVEVLEVSQNYNTVLSKIVLGQEIKGRDFVGMDLGAVLIYDRALTETERTSVNDFLSSKYLISP
jgi:hypothetical protein